MEDNLQNELFEDNDYYNDNDGLDGEEDKLIEGENDKKNDKNAKSQYDKNIRKPGEKQKRRKKMNVMKEIINVVVEKNTIHIQHYILILKQNMMVRHQRVLMLIKSRMEKGISAASERYSRVHTPPLFSVRRRRSARSAGRRRSPRR